MTNRVTKLYETVNKALFLCGLCNFCVGRVNFSETFLKRYRIVNIILNITTYCYTLLLLSAFVTQKNLTKKQQADLLVCNLSNPCTHFYCLIFMYHCDRMRHLLYKLLVKLKQEYSHEEAEELLLSNLKMYMIAYLGSATTTFTIYAIYGVSQMIRSGLPFITIITGWPAVNEISLTASIARYIFYIYWWISFARLPGGYLLLLSALIGLSSQYRNLQKYFMSLNDIWGYDLSQEEKEKEYAKAFIKGVKMHVDTIWCTNECKSIFRWIFDTQMLLAFATLLSSLPVLLSSNRDFETILTNVPITFACLVTSAFFMWNAGDIYVEASLLPDAIFSSGWENSRGASSVRVRKVVMIAMMQAHMSVQLKALGFVILSYETFLGIIKTSHSLFSVFY